MRGARGESFGSLLARARRLRDLSQMKLALQAGISARHLGFLEIGRARPSETMVAQLANALGLTAGEYDEWLLAAGYAPRRPDLGEGALSGNASLLRKHSMGEEAFAAALAIQSQRTPEAAMQLAARFFSTIGMGSFAAGTIELREGRHPIEIVVDGSCNAPVDYLSHFWANGYLQKCALVAYTCVADAPFFWDEIPRRHLRRLQRRIIDEAREFDIKAGFVIPIRRADGTVRSICCWAEGLDSKDLAVRTAGRLVGTALLDTLDQLRTRTPSDEAKEKLSRVEIDILSWLAAGRSIDWISDRTSMPSDAVLKHLKSAMIALGAADATQAISRAIGLGLIDD